MTDEEWGPWIEHDGKGCPCVGAYTQRVKSADGRVGFVNNEDANEVTVEGITHDWELSWDWANYETIAPDGYMVSKIVRYRIRRDDVTTPIKDDA